MTDKLMNRHIKDALVTLLSGLTLDGSPAFAEVIDNTHNDYEGSPIARVLPNGMAIQTSSNWQMDHTVKFSVIVTWPLQDVTDIESDIYDNMYDVTDLVINAVESADFHGTLSTLDPTIQDWRMDVTGANWKPATGKGGAMLLDEINVSITYSQDIT